MVQDGQAKGFESPYKSERLRGSLTRCPTAQGVLATTARIAAPRRCASLMAVTRCFGSQLPTLRLHGVAYGTSILRISKKLDAQP